MWHADNTPISDVVITVDGTLLEEQHKEFPHILPISGRDNFRIWYLSSTITTPQVVDDVIGYKKVVIVIDGVRH